MANSIWPNITYKQYLKDRKAFEEQSGLNRDQRCREPSQTVYLHLTTKRNIEARRKLLPTRQRSRKAEGAKRRCTL